jgi:cytochrome c oxidase cbb3-type subunit 3
VRAAGAAFALLAAALGAACPRETRDVRAQPAQSGIRPEATPERVVPGPPSDAARFHLRTPQARDNPYIGNAYAVSEGQRLFSQYNCTGCHARGGGGMGPALIDSEWRYGESPGALYETISEGRENGMPAFGRRIPEYQIWQLVAYVGTIKLDQPIGSLPGPRQDHLQASDGERSR